MPTSIGPGRFTVVYLGSRNHRLDVPLRRIEVWNEEQPETLVFPTNHLSFTDPERATQQPLDLVLKGKVQELNGSEVKIHADTLCVHGDNPNTVVLLTRVRNKLREAGVEILSVDLKS